MSSERIERIRADQNLLNKGWGRRFLVELSRVDEVVELYTGMGLEVHAGRLTPADFGEGCGTCSEVVCAQHVLIYTRKQQEETGEES